MFIKDLIVPEGVSQILVVEPGKTQVDGHLLAFRCCSDGAWSQDLPVIRVVLGKAGVTSDKVEGDNKTPLGLFPLGTVFGRGPKPDYLKLDYRELNNQDKFIDDPKHPDYNCWVNGETSAKSYETMHRDDDLYDLGIVINYNMEPVVAGKGSAIFIHIWRARGKGTEGCIAMRRSDLEMILSWFRPGSCPQVYITREQS